MNPSVFLFLFFVSLIGFAQEEQETAKYTLDIDPYYGSVLLHNPDISHLINAHPNGLILGLNKKTFGDQAWHKTFNYPDTGFSFIYQNMRTETLGKNYGIYAHYNFYFFKRHLQFRIGQGIAYNTNPYDKNQNFRNSAYGSHLLSSTYLMFNYHKEHVFDRLGVKAGISLIHYSNANFKAPNTSTNTLAFNLGVLYDLNDSKETAYLSQPSTENIKEPIRFNVAFRTGLNESDVINSGQFPFYIISGYADKRIGKVSALQFGGDIFFSQFLKKLILFQSISFPENGVNADDDFKRVGLFLGHELFINKMSIVTQLGYYVYYPFDFEGRVYNRIGLKRYFNDKWFGAVTLKSHGAAAEAVEFGVGIRF